MKFIDMTGQRFGRLTVIERSEIRNDSSGRRRTYWKCLCDCGNTAYVLRDNLVKGVSNSCGCYRKESQSQRQGAHRETRTRLYSIWAAMKRRCYNRNTKAYVDYGGRGITVCDEWLNDYTKFRDWATANGYEETLSIDRIDNNGSYCPDNCRWVGRVEQANNRRSNRNYTYNGKTRTIMEWSKLYNIPYKKLHRRLSDGWDFERAIKT